MRAHLDGDVLEQLDRHLEPSDPLERVAADLAPVDADLVLLPQLVGDVRRRDRSEQRAGGAGLHVESELDLREALRDRLCILERLRLALGTSVLDLAHLRDARRCRRVGETAREEEVARVAARDVHDLAAETDLVDVRTEDDFQLTALPAFGDVRAAAPSHVRA